MAEPWLPLDAPLARPEAERSGRVPAHAVLAEQLRRQVELRLILPGTALPPERELMRIFGVGRGTVQRALAALAGEGLIEKRLGRRGGAFVTDAIGQRRHLERALQRVREEREQIVEALDFRLQLEPGLVATACTARSAEDLDAIRVAQARLVAADGEAAFMHHDDGFHAAVARATHNRFLQAAAETVRVALNDALWVLPGSHAWLGRTLTEHQAIVDALARGNAAAGRRAALAHLLHTDQSVRALLASL